MKFLWKVLRKTLKWTTISLFSVFLLISFLLWLFKDDIIDYTVKEVNKHLTTRVDVQSIDLTFWSTFPAISVDFNKVKVREAYFHASNQDTLLYTDQIRLKFDLWQVLAEDYQVKEINIAPGVLNLRINDEGKPNYNIFVASKSNEKSDFTLGLNEVNIENLRFSYKDQPNFSSYVANIHDLKAEGNLSSETFDLHVKTAFLAEEVKSGKVPFVIGQEVNANLNIAINTVKNAVNIPMNRITVAKLPFDFSLKYEPDNFDVHLSAQSVNLQDLANNLSVKEVENIQKYEGQGTADFKLIVEKRETSDTKIDCDFGIHRGDLREPSTGMRLSAIELKGKFSQNKGSGSEHLNLQNASFITAAGNFAGNLSVDNFLLPKIKGKAKGRIHLKTIQDLFHLPKINRLEGILGINTLFSLHTEKKNNGDETLVDNASGTADLENVVIQLANDTRIFNKVNGNLGISTHEAVLKDLTIQLGQSDLRLNGAFNQMDLFLQNKGNLKLDVLAESKHIDLEDFTNKIESTTPDASGIEWMLPQQMQGDVQMDIKGLRLQKHLFQNIAGNLKVSDRLIQIAQLTGVSAEAKVDGSVRVQETQPSHFDVTTQLHSANLKFAPLFQEWNNFDQEVIKAENIQGKADVKLKMQAPFDLYTGIEMDKIIAQIDLKVTDGKLKNVETFQTLINDMKTPQTKLVLKSREIDELSSKLKSISFSTLENTLYIKNSALIIPKMLIESSALNIGLEGTHSFNNDIDYRFQFRLRNLKMQEYESEFGIVEDDGTGLNIYVRMYGNLANPKIEWDKDAKKAQAKANREAAKNEAMSILKSEFGLFKKDSTIQKFNAKPKSREILELNFEEEEPSSQIEQQKEKERKKGKVSKLNERLRNEGKKQNQVEFEDDL